MDIIEHPEWSDKYSAVDGIEQEAKHYKNFPKIGHSDKKKIRSDIVKILKLNDDEFIKWFSDRKIAAQKLLGHYELIGDIPDLSFGCEDRKNNLNSNCYIKDTINVLKRGIEYLEIIKQVRGEQKG